MKTDISNVNKVDTESTQITLMVMVEQSKKDKAIVIALHLNPFHSISTEFINSDTRQTFWLKISIQLNSFWGQLPARERFWSS